MDKHKQYNIPEDEEPMIVSEQSAAYGAAVAYDEAVLEDFADDDELDEFDLAEPQWDIDDPEMKELIEKSIILGIEQVKRGEWYTLEEVIAKYEASRLCR